MPGMGHPMKNAGTFEMVSEGVYLNTSIEFNMGGEWEMFLMLVDEDFEVLEEVSWTEFL
jgi:hypothetical protein